MAAGARLSAAAGTTGPVAQASSPGGSPGVANTVVKTATSTVGTSAGRTGQARSFMAPAQAQARRPAGKADGASFNWRHRQTPSAALIAALATSIGQTDQCVNSCAA